ncbi:MAG: penicillin-binding protein 1C [Parvularculaceae bacterium]
MSGLILLIFAADILFPPPLERAEKLSPLVVDREGRWLHAFQTEGGRWRFAADLDEIDSVFVERLIAIEDKRFYRHPGVDVAAIGRAGLNAARAGRIVSGASTLTMQTARLLEPRPRTFASKAIEIARALQIERRLSKREILELYLTLAPYGGNLEGVRAASLTYFGKEPARLTDAEQALLIALPQAPEARRPDRRSNAARTARGEVLEKLVAAGALDAKRAEEAAAALLPTGRKPYARAAYHTARRLAKEHAANNKGVVISSLNLLLQMQAEAIVAAHAARGADGATAAALIIDNETRAVRAAVGSSSLDAPGGWIDLTNATRSPGSALKPFIYALVFEDGLAGPGAVIDDMPRAFGGYAPENFDRVFRGEVRIREALQHSLNVPAVRALDKVGAPRFAATLKAAGVRLKTPDGADKTPGLAIALGGAGVTERDIAALYAALADDGRVSPLNWTETEENERPATAGYRLMSENTARRVSAILADGPSLAGRAPAALVDTAPRIAFKTGTSYGYRDAWAAGHAGRYTVVAWVGRADGAPRPGKTGREAAAPLLFDLFDMLARNDAEGAGRTPPVADETLQDTVLTRFGSPQETNPPEIVFPRNGIEIFTASPGATAHGFALAARGGSGGYRWYVNGDPLTIEVTSGRAIWRPAAAGFYDVAVVDQRGKTARAKVRVTATG